MKRIQHDLVQGTPAWDLFRLEHHGASEAAAMMGLSPYMKRSELLRMKHTGLPREFSDWVQEHVLDHGHAVEALARPHIEALIGEDLYPATYSLGKLSASCDGLTMAEDIAFEHKQWSESLASRVRAGEMPEEHMPQCQQVMLVTGASRCIFVVSDGTPKNLVHIWVDADPAWHPTLIDGWAQFDKDLQAYVPPAAADPVPIGRAPETLPALNIEVTGMVTRSNLAEFKQTALSAIQSVNRTLKTDQDFADAAKAVKWCEDIESRIKAAKEHALSQTSSIEELFRTLDEISGESKRVRLDVSKLVDRRKTEVKEEAILAARAALDKHIADLNGELAPMRLLPVVADFAGAIRGLRSIASMQDALDTTLAGAKIAADTQARGIRANLATFKEKAASYEALFADLGTLVHKAADDFALVLQARIDRQRADELKRAEADRERIRAEEEVRARRLAAEQEAREQEQARQTALAAQRAAEAEAQREAAATPPSAVSVASDLLLQDVHRGFSDALASKPDAMLHAREAAAVIDRPEPATITIGSIKTEIFGDKVGLTQAYIAETLGVPAHVEGGAVLYTPAQRRLIVQAFIKRLQGML